MPTRSSVKIPHLGDDIVETVVVDWVAELASWVDVGGVLAIVEADKVDVEVPSVVAGVVIEYLVEVGTQLCVGEPFCVIETP
jgi:pyruvate/2-oxoglutarate dehydrogenase complex dihydrolipoamide acyltransferase (E2) component